MGIMHIDNFINAAKENARKVKKLTPDRLESRIIQTSSSKKVANLSPANHHCRILNFCICLFSVMISIEIKFIHIDTSSGNFSNPVYKLSANVTILNHHFFCSQHKTEKE